MEKQNETIKNFSDEVIKAEYERRFMKEPCAVCKNYCDENSDWGRIDDVMSNDIVCSDKIYITKYCPNCVSECCPHCCNEATIKWNVEEDGYKAYCPVCGKVLMLCSQCDYENGCDWDNENNTCKHNLKDELSEIGK